MISERLLAQARAALDAVRRPVRGMAAATRYRPLDDLELFRRVPLWTVLDVATYQAQAMPPGSPLVPPDDGRIRRSRDALQRLQCHGVIGRIGGPRLGGGGSIPDTYFRTKLGAAVLDLAAGDAPGTLPSRHWVLDAGSVGAKGLVTHRKAAFVDPHELAIYEIARHCRLADAANWQVEWPLPYRIPYGGGEMSLIPDLAMQGKNGWCCLEIEGTHQHDHIEKKHRKYDALARWLRQLDPPQILFVGVIFVDVAHRRRLQLLHENAYAAGKGAYVCGWLDRPTILATHQSPDFWRELTRANHAVLGQRQRQYLDGQRARYDDGDPG